MGTFSQFSVARELLQRGELEQALAEVDRVVGLFGKSVEALELQVDIRGAIVAKNRTPEQEARIWFDRGYQQAIAGDCLGSIESYDQALQLKPNHHEAWFNQGNRLDELGRYEAAIESYDQALQLKPDHHEAWNNRGVNLAELGKYEAAIESYDQALKIKPGNHDAWYNCGIVLNNLGEYEAAIASFDQTLQIKPDLYQAWNNRGIAALFSRGPTQLNAYMLKHPELNQRGYSGELASLTVGLTYGPSDTHPLGHGFLQRKLGDAHWDRAPTQSNPRYYRRQALTAYEASLHVLNAFAHPEERLQTLQKLIRTHDALREIAPDAIQALLRQGSELRTRILTQARSDEQRERLTRTLPNFNELTVDFHLSQGNTIAALETAEAAKNGLMQWLLPVPGTANYAEMREMIGDDTAIVYWYLGANAIATFVIRADQVEPIVVTEFDREISLKMRDRLDEWIKNWNKSYTNYKAKAKDSDIATDRTWRDTLPTELETLAEILNISALLPHIQNIPNLILVPHRDLHRFPLHTFFPAAHITHLPSLHLGRHLRPHQPQIHNLLNIVAPDHTGLDSLPEAPIEAIALDRMFQTHQIPTTKLENATHQTLTQSLPTPHSILHFNGHAGYNPDNPKLSSLGLQGDDRLTTIDLTKIPALRQYNLITLTSCETAITGNQTLTAEYVGLISGFLGHRIPHVLSTLWTIESAASTLFILQFYRQLLKGQSPSQSLTHSQTWLQTVTVRQLRRHYSYWIDRLPAEDEIRPFLKTWRNKLGTMEPNQTRYSHPYYWAAFTLSGRG